mgnify:CR=1 FL=1
MKSIGKHNVAIKSFCDGVLNKSSNSYRVVYEGKNGDYYINDLGRKKKIEKSEYGFKVEFHSKTIVSNDAKAIFESLGLNIK